MAFMTVAFLSLGSWPLMSNAVPIAIPPSIPPSIALLFLCVYIPIISIAILLSPAQEGVMKNTPRKNNYFATNAGSQRVKVNDSKRKADEGRFIRYLCWRSGFVVLSVFLVGWTTAASSLRENGVSLFTSMQQFHDMLPSPGAHVNEDILRALYLTQDMMANAALLGILSQALTLLERGQQLVDVEAVAVSWPGVLHHKAFYTALALCLVIHCGVMLARALLREVEHAEVGTYSSLPWLVWLLLLGLPAVGTGLGSAVNSRDDRFYRRYLQFLRLEFDTRLGMHSPR